MSESNRTIVVVAALGNQGLGVVQGLLGSSSKWNVRALTRDPTTASAKEYLAQNQTNDSRLSLVAGFPYDPESLKKAFSGAYGVFAVTNQAYPGKVIQEESDLKHELTSGENMIRAAKEAGVKHFVFSSCPGVTKASNGRFRKVSHMDHKAAIERMAREELDGFTAISPGFFYTNHQWPLYTRLREDGVVRFCTPCPGDKPLQWVDPSYDMSVFVTRIFDLGLQKTNGKYYLAQSRPITCEEMAKVFTRVTGKQAYHDPTSTAEFAKLAVPSVGPAFEEDAKQMMDWISTCPPGTIDYGSKYPKDDYTFEDLGVQASSFEDWLERSGFTGPTEVFQ